MLITGYNNSVMSCDDINIDQFLLLFFYLRAITRISSRVSLYFIMIDQINKDGLKIHGLIEKLNKLYFLHLIDILNDLILMIILKN